MAKKKIAKSTEELDRRCDEGEDIHDLIDMSKARIIRHGKEVRITLDVAEELVNEIDRIRESIGVDRGALIKIWLHERVKQEKVTIDLYKLFILSLMILLLLHCNLGYQFQKKGILLE